MKEFKECFKAGDFTSGKMGEIFKHCFQNEKTTIINHKQFGSLAMLSEDYIKFIVSRGLKLNKHFIDFAESEYKDKGIAFSDKLVSEAIICDYLDINDESFDWFSVLMALFLNWSNNKQSDLET